MRNSDGNCSGLFYPRRIGRAPRGFPILEEGMYARVPQQSKILGAAKLTGRAGQFSFGALNATTADEQAVVANGPLRTRESVEPLANYSVVRARREFANQSSIGFMVTDTKRRLKSRFPSNNTFTSGRLGPPGDEATPSGGTSRATTCAETDAIQHCRAPSTAPASPCRHGSARTSLSGASASIAFSKIGGSKVRFSRRRVQVSRIRPQRCRLHAPR
jgi:hypothetical protein